MKQNQVEKKLEFSKFLTIFEVHKNQELNIFLRTLYD